MLIRQKAHMVVLLYFDQETELAPFYLNGTKHNLHNHNNALFIAEEHSYFLNTTILQNVKVPILTHPCP